MSLMGFHYQSVLVFYPKPSSIHTLMWCTCAHTHACGMGERLCCVKLRFKKRNKEMY